MDWILVKNNEDLERLHESITWEDARVAEVYCHSPLLDEQPPGASASGKAALDVRILLDLGNETYLELVLDHTEYFSLSFIHETFPKGNIDSLGRFEGELGLGGSHSVRCGRMRYRFVDGPKSSNFFFKTA